MFHSGKTGPEDKGWRSHTWNKPLERDSICHLRGNHCHLSIAAKAWQFGSEQHLGWKRRCSQRIESFHLPYRLSSSSSHLQVPLCKGAEMDCSAKQMDFIAPFISDIYLTFPKLMHLRLLPLNCSSFSLIYCLTIISLFSFLAYFQGRANIHWFLSSDEY